MTTFLLIGQIVLVIAAIVAVLAIGGLIGFLAYVRFVLEADEPWSPEVVERRRSRVDVRPERRR